MVEMGDRLLCDAGGRKEQVASRDSRHPPVSGTGDTGHGGGTLRFLFLLWEKSHQCRWLPDAFKLKVKAHRGWCGEQTKSTHARPVFTKPRFPVRHLPPTLPHHP